MTPSRVPISFTIHARTQKIHVHHKNIFGKTFTPGACH